MFSSENSERQMQIAFSICMSLCAGSSQNKCQMSYQGIVINYITHLTIDGKGYNWVRLSNLMDTSGFGQAFFPKSWLRYDLECSSECKNEKYFITKQPSWSAIIIV